MPEPKGSSLRFLLTNTVGEETKPKRMLESETAIGIYSEGLKVYPKDVGLRTAKIKAFLRLAKFEQALSECEKLKPEAITQCHSLRLDVFRLQNKHELALIEVNELLKPNPNSATWLYAKGDHLVALHRWKEAEPVLAAAEKGGQNVDDFKSQVFFAEKKYKEALVALNKVTSRGRKGNPMDFKKLLVRRVEIDRAMGRNDLAAKDEAEIKSVDADYFDDAPFRVHVDHK